MTDTSKVLAQTTPAATTLTDSYTVPGGTAAVISSITICNRSATASTFRVSVAVAGAADDNKQYIYYDTNCPGNDTLIATVGLTLAATDVIRVYTANATTTFQVFGIEIS